MQFEKQFSGARSRFAFARHGDKAGRYPIHLTRSAGMPRSSCEDDTPRRAIPAAVSALMARAVAGFAACADVAFPNFMLAVMSWTMAQALAGCAAYAQAMYPGFVDHGEQIDCRDPEPGAPKDIAAISYDIECFARRGDRCE
jgi:hypothetical protein